jgi:hypothetical protein
LITVICGLGGKEEVQMTTKNSIRFSFVAAAALVLTACGGSSSAPQTTATIGTAGGTLRAGAAALSIPAGALKEDHQVTLREAEPHHAGRATRVEVEPKGLQLEHPAEVAVQVDDKNAHIKMHDGSSDDLVGVEVEDQAHHSYKTSMSELGEIEVEVEHGAACATACAANEECDDGVCKAHVEDAAKAACSDVCATGEECDDGVCKPHGGVAGADDTTNPPAPGTCNMTCGSGLECDNGICTPHKNGTP